MSGGLHQHLGMPCWSTLYLVSEWVIRLIMLFYPCAAAPLGRGGPQNLAGLADSLL